MSYEEARKDRKRSRRNQNMSLILGLLSGLGRTFMQQKQMGEQREWMSQRDALKEQRDLERMEKEQAFRREENALSRQNQLDMAGEQRDWMSQRDALQSQRDLERMEREQAFRREESALNRQNQIDIAGMWPRRQQGGGLSQWESYGEGVTSQYGDNPEMALEELHRQLAEADPMEPDGAYERLMSDRKAILTMRGRAKRLQQQGMPQSSRTGDLTSGSPSAGPNAQAVQGQHNYERTYRALMAAQQGGDPMAYETIRQTYPQLNLPPYAIASPDLFAQGMPQ